MRTKGMRFRILIILLILSFYVAVLSFNAHESERRSLRIREEARSSDNVLVTIRIVNLNINTGEIEARLRFQPMGKVAKDEVTPAVNLKLFLNSIGGPQEVDFPRGKRINPIEAVFVLEGDANRYPFDSYATNLLLLMTTPSRGQNQEPPASPSGVPTGEGTVPKPGELILGAAALSQNEPVPTSVDLSASVPGIKFMGKIVPSQDVTGIELSLRRPGTWSSYPSW